MKESATSTPSPDRGFSLVELLIVVTIIAIMAAVSLPMVNTYLRVYKVRGASQEVAKEIQAARGRAISKNVNFGMVFLVVDNISYQWVAEDDQNTADAVFSTNARVPLAGALTTAAQHGAVQFLPRGVEFSTLCGLPTAGTTWERGMRFNRLGASCRPAAGEPCPPIAVGAPFVLSGDASAIVCLRQVDTGLTRTVAVSSGGRVQTQQ